MKQDYPSAIISSGFISVIKEEKRTCAESGGGLSAIKWRAK